MVESTRPGPWRGSKETGFKTHPGILLAKAQDPNYCFLTTVWKRSEDILWLYRSYPKDKNLEATSVTKHLLFSVLFGKFQLTIMELLKGTHSGPVTVQSTQCAKAAVCFEGYSSTLTASWQWLRATVTSSFNLPTTNSLCPSWEVRD